METADTPREEHEDGPSPRICPECGEGLLDATVTHCCSVANLGWASEEQTQVDRIVGGRYRLIGKLGEGGMGTVYAAEHSATLRRVALKIIRRELAASSLAQSRFLRECQTLERIKSPHVVEVLESGGSKTGEIYLVMELLRGTPLGERLESGPLSIEEAARTGAQITAALAAAHEQGIVHRDLKPDNVFLCEDGTVKVLDFGIARLIDDAVVPGGGAPKLTATGTIVGTPAYMSPEAVGGRAVGPAADLYSLGLILFEMVSGVPPFTDAQPVLLMGKHLTETPPPLPVPAPQALTRLIARLLEKDPKARPSSATEVGVVLSALATSPFDTALSLPRPRRARTWRIGVIALFASGLAVGAAIASFAAERAVPDAAVRLPDAPPVIEPLAQAPQAPVPIAEPRIDDVEPGSEIEVQPEPEPAPQDPEPRAPLRPARVPRPRSPDRPVAHIETTW